MSALETSHSIVTKCVPAPHRISMSLVLLALITARWLAFVSAGGLWRDEVHSVDMATAASDNLFHLLTNDSFPILWQVVLRVWIGVFGGSDGSVRVLGLLIGLAVVPALWWMARQFGIAFPWWSMVLLGLDPSLVVYGGEVRGYGLGVISFLMLMGVAGRILKQPTTGWWIGLTVAAFLAVHASYTNCFLLGALFVSCGVVALRRGSYRVCAGFALIGMMAAVTMLPYVLYVMPRLASSIRTIQDPSLHWTDRFNVFVGAFQWGGMVRLLLWPAIGGLGILTLIRHGIRQASHRAPNDEQELAVFVPTLVLLGTGGFWFYINWLGVPTQCWYYLPYLTLLAVATDISIHLWERCHPERTFRHARLATVACLLIFGEMAFRVPQRLTSMDLVAREISAEARKGDLIIVTPWYLGISFNRYYRGRAEWMNLPDVDRDRGHNGYDELFHKVMPLPTQAAILPELDRIESVLRSGGTVWWIGATPRLQPGEEPLTLQGGPDPKYGWSEDAYNTSWQQLALARMHHVGVTVSRHRIARPRLINQFENPGVFSFKPRNTSQSTASDCGGGIRAR